MNNTSIRSFFRVLPVALLLALAGCGGGADGSSGKTNVRLLNLSTGYDSLDLYANNGDTETDTTMFTSVGLGALTSYTSLKGDTYTLKFRKSGTTGNLTSTQVNLAGGTYLTLIAFGGTNRFALDVIDEDIDVPSTGFTKMQVVNTSFDQGFDLYLTGATDSLDDVSPTASSIAPRSQSAVQTVNSGTYRVRVTRSGDKTDLRLNIPQLTLASTGVISFIVTQTDGGVLVNAIVLPKRGQPTTYTNTSTSQFRALNVSVGYDPIDVATVNSADDPEVSRFTGVVRGTATSYTAVPADTYSVKFRRTGAAGNLLSLSSTLGEDRHTTYVSYGTINHFSVVPIDEEVTPPDPGYTKVQILNGTSADRLDVYLTDPGDSLNNVSAVASNVSASSLSGYTLVRNGTYRLRLTKAGDKADVRLDVPSVTLQDRGVLSIIVSETLGGVLLDAVLLPQQGTPVRLDNGNIRIRGAVGLPTGSQVTVKLSGNDIVTNVSARSFIASAYTIRPAGIVPVTVFVDGVLVPSASQNVTLQAGRDYTLLVWESSGTRQVALIADSNFASANQKPRLRLLNAASGLAAPLRLDVDNSVVVADYVQPGAASEVAELNSAISVRLDVRNANTLAILATLGVDTPLSLQTDSVYTLFMFGGGSSSVLPWLNKDR